MSQPEVINQRYQIRTKNGHLQRVNIEHAVINLEPVLALQQGVKTALPQINLHPDTDLHLTLYHFGMPEQLFHDLRRYNPQLEFNHFVSDFLTMAVTSEHAISEEIELMGESLAKFGNHRQPVVVLKLADDPRLLREHHLINRNYQTFLEEQGVPDVAKYMKTTYAHFQLDSYFKSHISLGRLPEPAELPDIDVTGIRLRLSPSRLRNVLVKEEGQWVFSH